MPRGGSRTGGSHRFISHEIGWGWCWIDIETQYQHGDFTGPEDHVNWAARRMREESARQSLHGMPCPRSTPPAMAWAGLPGFCTCRSRRTGETRRVARPVESARSSGRKGRYEKRSDSCVAGRHADPSESSEPRPAHIEPPGQMRSWRRRARVVPPSSHEKQKSPGDVAKRHRGHFACLYCPPAISARA